MWVSVLEERGAFLRLGPRVLHGFIPWELPEIHERCPQHQPADAEKLNSVDEFAAGDKLEHGVFFCMRMCVRGYCQLTTEVGTNH